MNVLLRAVASLLVLLGVFGCATAPLATTPSVSGGGTITVAGFVKTPGSYHYHEGMTVADALRDAGGYDHCSSCEQFYRTEGVHPTFDLPPKIKRGGQLLRLPEDKVNWMRFTLQESDEVKFRHIWF